MSQRSGNPPKVKAGDLIAFSGDSLVSDLVNIVTYGLPRWSISHVGLMGEATDGRLLLFESTTLDGLSCEITDTHFDGTQAHSLEKVIAAYRGKVWLYPLYRRLYDAERQRLTSFLMATIGVPYDQLGAMRSAGVGLSWIESLFREQNLSSIFCSEMAAAAYAAVGLFATDNVSRWSPNRLTRHLRWAEILLKPRRLK